MYREWYRMSASGEGEIFSSSYECENPKGIVQISHGMVEYSARYEGFARFLQSNGYVVCANDHLGHGKSLCGHRGTFANQAGGFDFVIEDMHLLFQEMREKYVGIPCILLGHSMGSILSGLFAERYDYLDQLILSGMPMPNPMAGVVAWILARCVKKHGYTYDSRIWNDLLWGSDKNKSQEEIVEQKAWLVSDKKEVEKYVADELCGFPFSDSANMEMISGLGRLGSRKWGQNIGDIPILIIAGAEDPVGKKGKAPRIYYERLKKTHTKVVLKLIDANRHEILNEWNKEENYRDILAFIGDGGK